MTASKEVEVQEESSEFSDNIITEIKKNLADSVAIRRHLHMYPELSFQEEQTRAFIQKELLKYGYEHLELNVGEGGILAIIDTDKPGPTIGLRADFDALPIQEENDLSFKSKNDGVMHACGHDVHTATLLSVARAILPFKDKLKGKLVFIFQHAEELPPGGAKAIVESGKLEDLDAVFGLHIQGAEVDPGKIYVNSGYAMAAADSFSIEIQGKGGHGSAPNVSIDAAVVAAYLIQELQTIVSRKKDPIKQGVLSITVFKAGEGADNIIADKAVLKGTVRTFEKEVQDLFEKEIKHISEHICQAHGASAKVTYERGYPAVYNHPQETAIVEKLFKEKFGEEAVITIPPAMGGEDFAYYLEKFPGTFFYVPAGVPEQEMHYPHHHPKFTADDETAILVGAEAFTLLIQEYLAQKDAEV